MSAASTSSSALAPSLALLDAQDFDLTQDQRMVRDMVRDFAQNELAPKAAQWDKEGFIPPEHIQKMADVGLLGMTVPEDLGGSFSDHLSYALAVEEVAACDAACSTLMSVHDSVGCGPLLKDGNREQQQTWLPKLASGEAIACFCLTEPQAGSEANHLKTRAVLETSPDGSQHWVLNGSKQFVTNGKRAQLAIVFAVTDPELGKKGISAFLVPTSTSGFVVARMEDKMGIRGSDTCAINLDNCRIPASNLLGARGKGLAIALSNLESGRIGIAAQALGIARAALQAAAQYAKDRVQFGVPIQQHQSIANMLADMATQLCAARLMVRQAARMKDAGLPCLTQASQAKLLASEMAEWVCSKAIQIHGGYGYLQDYTVERLYRDARITQIYEGSSEIQRMVIARAV